MIKTNNKYTNYDKKYSIVLVSNLDDNRFRSLRHEGLRT